MRIPFLSLLGTSPFEGLHEHAVKVKDCALVFQQAVECYLSKKCRTYEAFKEEFTRLEQETDEILRQAQSRLPREAFMAVDKFQVFWYVKEQHNITGVMRRTLDWTSYRAIYEIAEAIENDIRILTDSAIQPVEELERMAKTAKEYFKAFSSKNRKQIKDIIRLIQEQEFEADRQEELLKIKIFTVIKDPLAVFHTVKFVEMLGAIADQAESTADIMRAMVTR